MTKANRRKFWMFAPVAVAGVTLVIFLGGWIVQLLWNWLLPPLFGWREVTFWQALGLLALCRILFGGSGFIGGRSKHGPKMDVTPEERERFRQRVRERLGVEPADEGGPVV